MSALINGIIFIAPMLLLPHRRRREQGESLKGFRARIQRPARADRVMSLPRSRKRWALA
jgi:hypothetical protein